MKPIQLVILKSGTSPTTPPDGIRKCPGVPAALWHETNNQNGCLPLSNRHVPGTVINMATNHERDRSEPTFTIGVVAPYSAAIIARLTDSFPPELPPVPVLRKICAWHDTFDPTLPSNKGASHSICADCSARLLKMRRA